MCASLFIASGATDMQVAYQMGHSKVETTKNIYGIYTCLPRTGQTCSRRDEAAGEAA